MIPDINYSNYTNDNAKTIVVDDPRPVTIIAEGANARREFLRECIIALIEDSHGAAVKAGWWHDIKSGLPLKVDVPQKLMLIVSELSEAMEGHRKNLMDDHLTDRPMFEAELADAIIRILDLAGVTGSDLAGAYVDKRAYNDNRPDHKREARLAAGGKAY